MKDKKYVIGLIIIVLIFGFLTVRMISKKVQNDTIVDDDRHMVGMEDYIEMTTMGKAPEFSFTDQNGNTITNKDYEGKVYVLEFFFATCPSICPVMNQNLIKIQNEFITKKNFGIASITINPENDTPEVLKNYADKYGVKNPNWHFLTGDRDDIFELANSGFNIYVGEGDVSNGGFEHSGLFALIDKNGNIVSRKDKYGNPIVYYDGLEDDGIRDLMNDIAIELRK
ncbi:protein SCO1/2 [Pustulibacterium marinum]|uniref:Protein SCO1/2 n=1 Tax=Pustulibacterium marinum TaxID=1224947 RepID=A0A1I7H9V9_9FLAO|nr:SCO family protein [Pustulibacterium marinum]SFU57473.1 protein SCO1/2 [Pustulibacterium marinum]